MSDQFFPFTIRCDRKHGWSSSDFRALFMRTKPDDMHWYGYDVVVLSTDSVEFRVFDMENAVYGGVGGEIARWTAKATVETTRACLIDHAIQLGEERLAREREYEKQATIAAYANELLSTAQQPTQRAEGE